MNDLVNGFVNGMPQEHAVGGKEIDSVSRCDIWVSYDRLSPFFAFFVTCTMYIFVRSIISVCTALPFSISSFCSFRNLCFVLFCFVCQSVSDMLKAEFPGTKFLLGPGLHRVAPGVEEVRQKTVQVTQRLPFISCLHRSWSSDRANVLTEILTHPR